jgi:DNA-directed RNA polymerase subunit RPC12/RpoP
MFYGIVLRKFNNLRLNHLPGNLCAFPGSEQWRDAVQSRGAVNLFWKKGDASMSCERCGGFKVFDYFDGPFHCSGYRCINCGAITDMQIAMATQTRTVVPPRRTKPVRRASLGTPETGTAHPGQAEHQP